MKNEVFTPEQEDRIRAIVRELLGAASAPTIGLRVSDELAAGLAAIGGDRSQKTPPDTDMTDSETRH